jgi:hypothetical protein
MRAGARAECRRTSLRVSSGEPRGRETWGRLGKIGENKFLGRAQLSKFSGFARLPNMPFPPCSSAEPRQYYGSTSASATFRTLFFQSDISISQVRSARKKTAIGQLPVTDSGNQDVVESHSRPRCYDELRQ